MKFFQEELAELEHQNLFRKIRNIEKIEGKYIFTDNRKIIDFSSNNYLGLRDDKRIESSVISAIKKYGVGSGASRLVTGTSEIHKEFEEKIAEFKNMDSAVLFNSGYDANVGVISSIMNRNDIVFSDRLNHASIIDGIKLSGAKLIRYKHNDINDLKEKLEKYRWDFKKAMIVTDSVFSMDGDIAPLDKISKLKEKFDLLFMVDEAHGTGLFGKNGSGVSEELEIKNVDVLMGTLGKAFGLHGAYVACKSEIRDFLINRARSLIYSTAIPTCIIAGSIKALEIIKEEKFRREKVLKNADYLRKNLKKIGFNTLESNTQIVPVIIGENFQTVKMSELLFKKDILAAAIRETTVPKGSARLRFSINYHIEKEDIDKILSILSGDLYVK